MRPGKNYGREICEIKSQRDLWSEIRLMQYACELWVKFQTEVESSGVIPGWSLILYY